MPRNIDPVNILDHLLVKAVEGGRDTFADKGLKTVQSKIRDVLGPICKPWTIIEKAATQENSEEKEDQVSLEDIIRFIEKSAMLLGQAKNKVVCFRRLNVLNVPLNSKSDANGILNTYTPLLSTNSTELFGRQFWKQVIDNTKAQKKTLEMFREVGKTKKKPFLAGFLARDKQSPRWSAGNHNKIPSINIFERNNNKDGREIQQVKPPINQMVRLQKQVATTFCNISVEKLEHLHPLIKEGMFL